MDLEDQVVDLYGPGVLEKMDQCASLPDGSVEKEYLLAELVDAGMTREPDGEGEGGSVWIGYYGEVYWNAS